MTILTPNISAIVEPLAVIQEGQIAGAAMRVPLDCVDLWAPKRIETSNPMHNAGETSHGFVV